ncbi:MAG: hypothetical protein NXI04_20155 [Planctomycetaceae bacterium]|nr:hypothetical protein [Planctomycetaceae bacterium]
MALKNEVFDIIGQLGPAGWTDLLKRVTGGQLDLEQDTADKLELALLQPVTDLDRSVPGFGDVNGTDLRGISAGLPSASLLYHALSSPLVRQKEDGSTFAADEWATPEQIATVENYIFSLRQTSLARLQATWTGHRLAIVVFSSSYRPAGETVHKKHADLCFSRTGVARVGTREPQYAPAMRQFTMTADEANACRVVPVQYSAWIAVKLPGSRGDFGPMRPRTDDDAREFWVPVHKLFDGDECLQGRTVSLQFREAHLNQKIRYFHEELLARGVVTGHSLGVLEQSPFTLKSDQIASIDVKSGRLTPIVHPALVAEASDGAEAVTYRVPEAKTYEAAGESPLSVDTFFSSLEARVQGSDGLSSRPLPEYAHARTRVVSGEKRDLNRTRNVAGTVGSGRYRALHYLDFAGDGIVSVDADRLGTELSTYSAYSLVSAPDFFPFVSQRELSDWPRGRDIKWNVTPNVLSDTRLPANFRSHDAFETEQTRDGQAMEDTITAVVSLPHDPSAPVTQLRDDEVARISTLPDGAAGVFAPGWDVSRDSTNNIDHLAAYGLGTPFPEDAKLCAALSSFWPAVAPDITRVYWPTARETLAGRRTIVPLSDEEVGIVGGPSGWDGDRGPLYDAAAGTVTYKHIDYVDYVTTALDGGYNFSHLAALDSAHYKSRITCLDAARGALLADILTPAVAALSANDRQNALRSFVRQVTRNDGLTPILGDDLNRQATPFSLRSFLEGPFVTTLRDLGLDHGQAEAFASQLIPTFARVVSVDRSVTREELGALASSYHLVSFREIDSDDADYVAARDGAPVTDAISHRLIFVLPGNSRPVSVDVDGTSIAQQRQVDVAQSVTYFSDGVRAWQG